jgi:hypothetical protein
LDHYRPNWVFATILSKDSFGKNPVMKKLYAIVPFLLVVCIANAKIWRVNNNTGITADFTTAQAAHDGAVAGDTLHFEPSLNFYGSMTMTKRLILIGVGDFLNINANQQASGIAASLNDITINNAGAAGSIIMVSFSYMPITSVPNVVVQRCFIGNRIDASDADNMVIRNCYFQNAVNILNGSTNILFHNNIVRSHINMDISSSATMLNNLVSLNGNFSSIYNSIIRSNIFIVGGISIASGSTIENNLSLDGSIPAGNGNQQNVNMTNVFINYNTGNDKDLQLKPASPAIGAGYGGVDAGAFGGASPYVLSVQPNIPAIYKLNAPPSVSGSTMNVIISTKSNN